MSHYEFTTKSAPIDTNLDTEIRKWAAEGWTLAPGHTGTAIYYLQRQVQTQAPTIESLAGSALGNLGIDDKNVFILRNGKLMSAQEADADASTKLKEK